MMRRLCRLALTLSLPLLLAGIGEAWAQPVAPKTPPAATVTPTNAPAAPPLLVELSQRSVDITTSFSGTRILVFGSTARAVGTPPLVADGTAASAPQDAAKERDQVLVVVRGPPSPVEVRRKIRVAGFWLNGPSSRFEDAPGFYAISGTARAEDILPDSVRQSLNLGIDMVPLGQQGRRDPEFRAALTSLQTRAGLWQENTVPVSVEGGRLFHLSLPLPATVAPGPYTVETFLVRNRQVVASHALGLTVHRIGTAAGIAGVAEDQPLLYGLACIALAGFAGWLGSVLFRRG